MLGNPLPDAALDKLERLHGEATPGEWEGELHHLHDTPYEGLDYCAFRTPEAEMVGFFKRSDVKCAAALHNAFPALLARLRKAEAERDERTVMAGRAQEALRYVMNGLPADDAVWAAYGNADSARAWLAARDARMKREGAAETWEQIAKIAACVTDGFIRVSKGYAEEQAEVLREVK